MFFEIISRMGSQSFGKRPPSRRCSRPSRSSRNVAGTCRRLDSIEFHDEDTGSPGLAGGMASTRCGCRGPIGWGQVQVSTGGLGSCWSGSEVLLMPLLRVILRSQRRDIGGKLLS